MIKEKQVDKEKGYDSFKKTDVHTTPDKLERRNVNGLQTYNILANQKYAGIEPIKFWLDDLKSV